MRVSRKSCPVALAAVFFAAGISPSFAASQVPPELTNWPEDATPEVVGKKVAQNMLPRWEITRPSVHYAQDSAWVFGLKFAQLTSDAELKEALVRRFDRFLAPEGRALMSMRRHVDHTIFGIVPLEIYAQTKDEKYLAIGRLLADRQWEPVPAEEENAAAMNALLAEGLSPETRYWIDDMYMITILQLQAFRATGDARYLDRAALEMVAYLDRLQQPNGLFFHGPDYPFFWGRGNGWVAAGLTELLLELPYNNPHFERVLAGYFKMMEGLLLQQASNGMWHQLLDQPESYEETSCTAMFTYAFITGLKNGWLTKTPHARSYAQGARNAWLALQDFIDAEGNIASVCVGTGQRNDVNYYLTRPTRSGDPHGQAPLLWCAVALLR